MYVTSYYFVHRWSCMPGHDVIYASPKPESDVIGALLILLFRLLVLPKY